MFDARRIFTHHHGRKILDRSHQTARLPFERTFAPAVKSGIAGLDFNENPVAHLRIHDEISNRSDPHKWSDPRLLAFEGSAFISAEVDSVS